MCILSSEVMNEKEDNPMYSPRALLFILMTLNPSCPIMDLIYILSGHWFRHGASLQHVGTFTAEGEL